MVKGNSEITLRKKELISLMISSGAIGFFINDGLGLFYHVINFFQ